MEVNITVLKYKKTKYGYETYGKKHDVIVFVQNILVLKISLDISSVGFFQIYKQ